jgi:folate-binding protein YgfZ
MATDRPQTALRPRDYVRVAGPDAEDFLQRMLSNDVTQAPCEALLLTPKGRLIAPLVVVWRGDDDFLLLTEPGLGGAVRSTLLRARFAAKVEIEPEEHRSLIIFGADGGIRTRDYGLPASEHLDAEGDPTVNGDELERMRIEAGTPAWGKELDDSILPAEAGLDERAISFTKGCYPGQEPIARLRHRGKVNRGLRVLAVEDAAPGDQLVYDGKTVGRITSAAAGRALAYVRVEVPADAELEVGGGTAKTIRAPTA